jgi:integrase/recombinase XerD
MNTSVAIPLKRFFSDYLPIQKGLAANTVAGYRDALKLLLCYAADRRKKAVEELTVEELDEPLVLAFLDHLETARGCSVRTRNVRLAAIRAFFSFVAREEPLLLPQCQAIRAIPRKRHEHRTMTYLEETETRAVLEAVDSTARAGVRDQALLLVLYNTGARVSEIVNLQVGDLRLDEAPQVQLVGKGGKHRSCPLWSETVEILRAYLGQRAARDDRCERVFLNANGSPLGRFGVRHILRKHVAQAAGACPSLTSKRVSPHTLRHTTAMHLLRSGNEVNMVGYWLGHADVNTTHAYVEIDMEMKRRMLEKAPSPGVRRAAPWRRPGIMEWLDGLTKPPRLCAANRNVVPENNASTAQKRAQLHITRGFT